MTIRDIIIKYSQELEKISDTPRLDVELFLQKALGDVDRIYIHLNLNKELTKEQYDEFLGYIIINRYCKNRSIGAFRTQTMNEIKSFWIERPQWIDTPTEKGNE